MTHTKDEALKLALEALTVLLDEWTPARQAQLKGMEAVTALKQALAAPVQPVPWSQALESVWAEPDDTPPAQPAPVQEPVVFFRCNGCGHAYEQVHPTSCDCMEAGGFDRVEYFTTPPAAQPAVPDVIHHTDLSEHPQYIEGWNDCRAEMLKGMKP